MPTAAPNIVDYVCVVVPVIACGFLGARGILPVMRGRFAIVAVAMFAAALCISMVLSFLAFALLSVLDDAVMAPQSLSAGPSSPLGFLSSDVVLPLARFVARSRFVRALLVAFVQPTLMSVSGIAACLMLLYVKDALVRIGGDVSVLLEHFAVFGSGATK